MASAAAAARPARFDARDAVGRGVDVRGALRDEVRPKEHASRSSSRFGARVASRARRDGASNRGFTSSHDRDVWWFRRGRKVSSRARRAASDASTRFVAAWRRAASILRLRVGRARGPRLRLGRDFGLRVVYPFGCVCRGVRNGSPLRRCRAGRRHRRDIDAPLEKDAGPAPERLARPRRVGRVLRVRLEVARRTFPYRRSPCAGGAALRGGSGGRRTSSCAPSFWNSRRAAA